MRVAITGGAGFVAQHVADVLAQAGHEVVLVDMVRREGVLYGDVRDLAAMRRAVLGAEVVFHLGAVSNTGMARESPMLAWDVNAMGTETVLRAAQITGVRRVVVASSTLVSGALQPMWANWPSDRILALSEEESPLGTRTNLLDPKLDWLVVDEESPVEIARPLHPYVATKLAAEMAARWAGASGEVETTILRYGIQYGPGMTPGVLFHTMITRGLNGEPLIVDGDGSQWRQYMHVDDLALAHLAVLENLPASRNQTFNVCPHRRVFVKDVAQLISDATGAPIEYGPERRGDIQVQFSLAGKAKSVLGWETGIDLEEGIEMTLAAYREGC